MQLFIRIIIFTLCFLIYSQFNSLSANIYIYPDTIKAPDSILIQTSDTTDLVPDTLSPSSNKLNFPISKDPIEAEVKYDAEDSINFNITEQKAYLYGNANVSYKEISLNADYIIFDWGKKLIIAEGIKDSNGVLQGNPIFTDADKVYNSEKIVYNYDTKKGKIYKVLTEESGGYVHGEQVKKNEKDEMFIKDAKYTTCNLPDPHFALRINKLKVIPDKQIVAGPALLEVEDIPTPLFLPFGIFPLHKQQASGILFPTYGFSTGQGYYLRNGGYYFGISDQFDIQLRGDIYSRGSWGLGSAFRFVKRYNYDGNLDVRYSVNKIGIPESPTYSSTRNFSITSRFAIDQKKWPNTDLNADIEIKTRGYDRNNSYNPNDFLNNQLNSAINFIKIFPRSPFTLTTSLRHNQNIQTGQLNLTLPDLALTMNRLYPFRRKIPIGEKKWYEKVNVNYALVGRNELSTFDSLIFSSPDILDDFQNGIRHTANIGFGTYKIMKYFNLGILPNLQYNEYWYFKTISKVYNPELDTVFVNDINGFQTARELNGISTDLTTNLYGLYNFKKGKIRAIRHQMTPRVSARYNIDFSDPRWGYYETVQTDSTGNNFETYSRFQNGVVGGPGQGEFGGIDFSLRNNIGAKIASKKDTLGNLKKISILDQLSLSTSYNIIADSLKWAPVVISGNTRIAERININFSSTLDPYVTTLDNQRINTFLFDDNNQLARLTRASLNVSTSLRSTLSNQTEKEQEANALVNQYPDDYVNFNIPWDITVNYNVNLTNTFVNQVDTTLITQSLTFNTNLSLTPKWKISIQSGYDFVSKKVTSNTSFGIFRDLHCWEMSFNIIPFGRWQNYNFTIRPKSTVLQDLKLTRKRDWFDN